MPQSSKHMPSTVERERYIDSLPGRYYTVLTLPYCT